MSLLKSFFTLTFVRVYLIAQVSTRFIISIYAIFHNQVSITELPGAFFIGLVNDFVSLFYSLPIILFISILFRVPFRKCQKFLLPMAIFGYFLLILGMLFNLVAELSFWDEYSTRYNFIAVDYLIYTQEIIGTLKESLPFFEILCAILVVSVAICIYSRRYVLRTEESCYATDFKFIGFSLALALFSFQFYNSEKCTLSSNVYAIELGKNGPYEFVSAFRNNELDYMKFYPHVDEKEALAVIRDLIKQSNQDFVSEDNIERSTKGLSDAQKYNVIVVTVESLSAEFMGAFGSIKNITPNLDRLAGEGLFFTNLYATGTRTVRGLEALTLGAPPLPGSSIIRRPDNNDLFNIGSVFRSKGYVTNFIVGGFSYFDNLGSYFAGNGFVVTDRGDLSKAEISFGNTWGVADEDILTRALKIADDAYDKQEPFFNFIMTTSNHRPYTFPDGRIDLPSGGGRSAAVKYTDYAIGKFIDEARSRPWFDNTIFIIVADHCASSAGKTQLPVDKYHIPLIIYAPKIIKPRIVDNLSSQIDVPATILGLLQFDYKSKFFGKDIINSPANRAFIGTYQLLGYMKDDHLVILSPKAEPKTTKLSSGEFDQREDLVKEAISFYQTTYQLLKQGKMKE